MQTVATGDPKGKDQVTFGLHEDEEKLDEN